MPGPVVDAHFHLSHASASVVGGATLLQNSLVPGAVVPTRGSYQSINSTNRPFVEATEEYGFSSHLTYDFGNGVTFNSQFFKIDPFSIRSK